MKFLTTILITIVGIYASIAQATTWDRQIDWDNGQAEGTTLGNPDDDVVGNLTWQYEYFTGGDRLGGAAPWFTQIAQLQVWTDSWFGQPIGGWVESYNSGPRTQDYQIVTIQNQGRSPVVRWLNPTGKAIFGRITGGIQIDWSAAAEGDVDLALVRDNGDGTVDLLWSETVGYQGGATLDLDAINIGFELSDDNDTVLFTYKTTGTQEWVNVKDDLVVSLGPYAPGFAWNRGQDWSGGQTPGSTEGNPDDDAGGRSTWTYGYVNSVQALGTSTPWYTQAVNLSLWDDSWFDQAEGAWVFDDNIAPNIKQNLLSIVSNQNRSVMIKWQNPTLEEQRINIGGSVRLNWSQSTSGNAEGNIEVAIIRQQTDGALEPLFTQTHHSADGNDKNVQVDLRNLTVAATDQIIFAYRSVPSQRWITVYDNLSITIANESYRLYVSTSGDDSKDGSDSSAALATLEGARDRIRVLRQITSLLDGKDVEVLFANGTYVIDQTVLFDHTDSGTSTNPVIYHSEVPGQAVFEGGNDLNTLVPGLTWSQHSGDIYVANVGSLVFNSLFVNGNRAIRARSPNIGFYPIITGIPDPYILTDSFQFSPGDIDPAWSNLQDVEIVSYHKWIAYRHQIDTVDVANSVVTVQGTSPILSSDRNFNFGTSDDGSSSARYYVENVLEAIDMPGEWYLDRNSESLYFHKYPYQSMNTLEFVVPTVERFIDSTASDIIFQGFNLRLSDWSMPEDGYHQTYSSGYNADVTRSIVLSGDRSQFLDNTISQTGGWALNLKGDNARVARNDFFNLGAGGVLIEDANNVNANSWVYDNTINNSSEVWADAGGLVIKSSAHNHIVANEISCAPYSGLVSQQTNTSTGLDGFNLIQHNDIHDVMKTLTDGAGIRVRGSQLGTVVQANHIKNIVQTSGLPGLVIRDQLQMGLYIDDFGEGFVMRENRVENTGIGFLLNNGRLGNFIENNIFVNASYRAIHMNYRSDPVSYGLTLRSNVIAWTEDPGNEVWIVKQDNNLPEQITDSNLYDYSVLSAIDSNSIEKLGTNPLINVDPQFVDHTLGDYRLQPWSPALTSLVLPFKADWLVNNLVEPAIPDETVPGDVCNPDFDNDGLSDKDETLYGTDPTNSDSDGDGLYDGAEIALGTNPLVDDTDADGILDNADNCPVASNSDQADLDSDGAGNVCDTDIDGDGYVNDSDNCPNDFNPNQTDTDGNGTGNVCQIEQQTLVSLRDEDGFILESSENSNEGGSIWDADKDKKSIRFGDDSSRRQFKSILSFDPSTVIPSGSTIHAVRLELIVGVTIGGTTPDLYSEFGPAWVDLSVGGFNGDTALEAGDFQAPASEPGVAALTDDGSNATAVLNEAGIAAIDAVSKIQFRTYFEKDDNNNRKANYVGYYSSNNSKVNNHPRLVVDYTLPD